MFCNCGCGGSTSLIVENDASQGLVAGEYRRFISGHNRRKSAVEYIADKKTGCWVWQRGITKNGYGQCKIKGKTMYAHRHYYEQQFGHIPSGLVIDHLCRNRACVNPMGIIYLTPSLIIKGFSIAHFILDSLGYLCQDAVVGSTT